MRAGSVKRTELLGLNVPRCGVTEGYGRTAKYGQGKEITVIVKNSLVETILRGLSSDWVLATNGEPVFKIDPLS